MKKNSQRAYGPSWRGTGGLSLRTLGLYLRLEETSKFKWFFFREQLEKNKFSVFFVYTTCLMYRVRTEKELVLGMWAQHGT
jgi:hypothetical protein